MLIGRELDLSPQDQETLRWASILHDVGKIGMPEGILQKPGRLTPEEFQVIKEHPDRGHRLLLPIGQLAQAAAIVRAHHETVDGKGYPLGLKGEEIPLLARIIAVADTFDALTSTRPYRTARPLDHALAEIRRVRGTQLDGSVVDGFLKLVPFLREHRVMIQAVSFPEREAAA
jgi:HD-GYP domain-containing protein (c-di-GMP phosphodiesterase class II)